MAIEQRTARRRSCIARPISATSRRRFSVTAPPFCGLLLSAAGAAGLSTAEPPTVRALPRDGLAVLLLLDLGHVTVHTMPAREILLLDLLVPAGRDPQKAVDVFTRKLGVKESRSGRHDRG